MSANPQALSLNSHVQDVEIASRDGFVVLAIQALVTLLAIGGALSLLPISGALSFLLIGTIVITSLFFLSGYYILDPNESAVHTFFGRYVGTVTQNGFRWNNPFYSTSKMTLKVDNFETKELKVNDLDGNPINISAVVVLRVRDSATARFAVDDYQEFIHIQAESALRKLASEYSYDSNTGEHHSLRESQAEVADRLKEEIQERGSLAGLEIIEARLNKLSYASEIAGAMLQRQQAKAVVAARAEIVEGAVGTVKMALDKLSEDSIVELDDERKAQMVSNLLVVLCSDRSATPIINAGSIHS